MKGYTIQNSIDMLEKAIENGSGSGGASTAADVSYDNTSSGLTADDVQEAIDELNGKFPERLFVPFTNIAMALGTAVTIAEAINVGTIKAISGSFVVDDYTYSVPDVNFRVDVTPTKDLQVTAPSSAMTGVSGTIIIEHIPATVSKTRKKK